MCKEFSPSNKKKKFKVWKKNVERIDCVYVCDMWASVQWKKNSFYFYFISNKSVWEKRRKYLENSQHINSLLVLSVVVIKLQRRA